jgi:7,8-dihydropterin-6-yl-methyl-4-(beta-D-ribofuranosyl)aminobenzene 5'-phosphate synthase
MLISVVCDDFSSDPSLRASPGFSCLVRGERTVLFDTGAHAPTLLYNMRRLGIEPQDIDVVVLSHLDNDHIGGLFGLLAESNRCTVLVPFSSPPSLRQRIISLGAQVRVIFGPSRICEGVTVTGEMGIWVREQSLILRSPRGVVAISADAHPGMRWLLDRVGKLAQDRIYLLLGGFGLEGMRDNKVEAIIQDIRAAGVEKVAPCHSCGERVRGLLRQEFQGDYVEVGVGIVMDLGVA